MIENRKLKVRFGIPKNGWITILLDNYKTQLSLDISYTPFHFLEELIEAIIKVFSSENAKARGNYNPENYEFNFQIEDKDVILQVLEFPDHKRLEDSGNLLFEHIGDKTEICKSFWRGFKDLSGRISAAEYKQHFHREFPEKDLIFLSEKLSS